MKYKVNYEIELKKNPYTGFYIAFEGIDGAGKTVQVQKLENYLISERRSITVTSEPRREGPVGDLIHQILRGKVKIPSTALQYLYTADRIINHKTVIDPALENGQIVISHRSLWSNLPYGMLDKKMTDFESNEGRIIDVAHGLMSLYHQFIIPDVTFYLRVTAETAMKRLGHMHKEHELYEKKDKLERIAKGYEWQVKKFASEFVVVDGEENVDEVFGEVLGYLKKHTKLF